MRTLLAIIGALAIVVAVVAGVYFLGGIYSVAASNEDSGPVVWALTRVRNASIARHARRQPPISVDDPATIQAGARNYAKYGCANCHGAPGSDWQKFAEGLNPGPPDLNDVAKARDVAQIFWVVKNGIRMTGMPSFNKAGAQDNDIWQIAAFVKKLPNVSEADYKSWAASQ
jgi:mono/diheme cytochrome c family protein